MNNIPNDVLSEIISNKIKLFTKELYYPPFRRIFLELSNSLSAFQKRVSLSKRMKSQFLEKDTSSLWQMIYKLIFPKKNEVNDNNINENMFNLHPICFEYLKNLCYNKMKKITNLCMIEKVASDRVIFLYLDLCEQEMRLNKEKGRRYKRRKITLFRKNTIRSVSSIVSKKNSMRSISQLKINTNKQGNKNASSIQPLEYNNSFTRLFIGETDEKAIRERYLSNMIVKKHKQLHLFNSISDISVNYLKSMYRKLFKKKGEKGGIDDDMTHIINQFENDHKKIEYFQRSSVINEKNHNFMFDYNQHNLLNFELNKLKDKNKKNKRNRNIISKFRLSNNNSLFTSNEISKNNNQENSRNLFNSKNISYKIKYHSIHYINNKKNDNSIFDRRIMNVSATNIKRSLTRFNQSQTKKRINKNFSLIISNHKYKNNTNSTTFLIRPKSNIKNYMNKTDFFFL